MSIHLQPPLPLVTLIKTEPPTVIKNEPPEEALEEEISTDVKEDIDIVYHPLCKDLKIETVLEDILESKHLESMQTQALVVKTENSPFIKTENITKRNKSEDTSDGNVSKGIRQGVVEVQEEGNGLGLTNGRKHKKPWRLKCDWAEGTTPGKRKKNGFHQHVVRSVQASNEHSNALSNLETDEQSVLDFSKDLNSIIVRSSKSKSPKQTDFAECYETHDTILWEKEKEKIKIIRAPMVPVEAHEHTSLPDGRHVCNHCQHTCWHKLNNLKRHIRQKHREVTTMYQCPYCLYDYKSKWSVKQHIILKHKNTKDIQWFQCNLCEIKFKLKLQLTQHMKVHLKHKQMQYGLDLRGKRQLQSPVPLVPLVKTEPLTVIKTEPPEEALEKEISQEINIVYHSLSDHLIKSETLLENIFETKYSESVETQILVKTEDQEVIEVQGSHEHSNTLSNLETHKQLVLNSSKDLNGISTSSRKAKRAKKTDFAQCSKTGGTSSDKEKIKVIRTSVIPVKPHEYTSLAKDKHVCNHCQHACKLLNNIKKHIEKIHRKVTTMYQCPYCTHKSKWKQCIINQHIILKHKDTKDIQWFQCHLFKLKSNLTQHMKVHLTHEQMQDLKGYHCDTCDYKTYTNANLKSHKLTHLKPEEIQYFYCYHCSHKYKVKCDLKKHIFMQHFKNVTQGKRYGCNKCDYKTYISTNLKSHKLTHLKSEKIQYFYCYYCSYKSKQKSNLKIHIFRHHFNKCQTRKKASL